MTYLKAFLLGLVQGVAEFLPISSSGHLAIARNLLNMEGAGDIPEFFDVLLHLGTLVAVFVAYWADIKDMVLEFFRGAGDLIHHSTPNPVPPARRLILLIILGTLPLFVVLPVKDAVRGACEMLGYDVLQVANEGKMVCVVPADEADAALRAMRANKYGVDAAIIGEVGEMQPERGPKVYLRTAFGGKRILDMLVGEQLPRIC